ncbi:MAG: alpha/beta hydrolase [Ornithinimicrobium sp.]
MSTASEFIDPESRIPLDQLLEALPGGFNAIPDIVQRRATVTAMFAQMEVPVNDNITQEDRTVPGPDGEPDISVRISRPNDRHGVLPGVFYIHGGGMVLGDVEGENVQATTISDEVGVVVVSVDYRLAPEHPYPAPVEDCYAGLVWMAEHAEELGIDPARIALYGGSAGGGLVLAVALLARDRGGPKVAFQMPIYPMIDDRNETDSSHAIRDVGIWDRSANIEAWAWYLGGHEADQYAAPARAGDLSGLPPTFIDVGTADLFLDEDIVFARRLMKAGVPTELHVHPGSYHASETFAPEARLSRRIWAMRLDALRRAFV